MENINLVERDFPYDIIEQINTLRTNVQFSGANNKVILVTSCLQHEGKSSVALELATSLSELDKNVLYIDADLRASLFMSKIVGKKPTWGLSHLLSGQAKLSEIIYRTNRRGLYAISSGPIPPNSTVLFSSNVFASSIADLRKIYEYIIIDTAPLGMVVDASIIARSCDASILVIKSGDNKYKFVKKVKEELENTGCPIIGVVLNRVKINKSSPYYGKYYGGYGNSEE